MSGTVSAAPLEIEAKLLVPDEAALRVIARLDRLGGFHLRPRGRKRLYSIYLDTHDLTLARHRVALRLRRAGRRWEATIKLAGTARGAIHARPEITVPLPTAPQLPFALPVGVLRTRLGKLVGRRRLAPILITDIERQLFDVVPPHERTRRDVTRVAELALDCVGLIAPDRSREVRATYYEVEIESTDGTRRTVTALANALRRRFGLSPSRESKFARGIALLYGPDVPSRNSFM